MLKYFIVAIAYLSINYPSLCFGQVITNFELNIELNGTDNSEDMVIIDHYIYVCGYSDFGLGGNNYIAISKNDKLGNTIWNKKYGTSIDDKAFSITKTWDKYLLVCGQSETSPSQIDAMIAKIDTLGNLIWIKTFPKLRTQVLDSGIESIDSNYVFCGFTSTATSSNEAYVAKTDTAGNILWEQFIGDIGTEYASGIVQSPFSQSIFVSFDTNSFVPDFDVGVAKLNNSTGAIEWSTSYPYPYSAGSQNILFTKDNNLLIVGETVVSSLTPLFDNYIQKIDTNGVNIWKKTFGSTGSEASFDVIESNQKFYLTGYSSSNFSFPNNGNDLVINCIDTAGNFKWNYFYGGTGADIGKKISKDDSHFWLCSRNTSTNNFYVIKWQEDIFFSVNEMNFNSENELLFPNPCMDKLIISQNKNSTLNYKVNNSIGIEVDSGKTINGEINITEKYINGVYSLFITNENNQTVSKKFVVGK